MRKEVTNMQYAIAHLDQDGNGDSDKNPYISVDFENNLESCLCGFPDMIYLDSRLNPPCNSP